MNFLNKIPGPFLVSLVTDFDKDRAMPMAPFLSIAGTGTYVGSFYYPEFFHLLIL